MLTAVPPLRVAVLCSKRAPGLLHLIDGNGRDAYDVVAVLTTEPDFAEQEQVAAAGIPIVSHPIVPFYEARGARLYRDVAVRRAYDRATVERLVPLQPDLILLDGYLFLVTPPLLDAFAARVLNLHFSDLSVRRPDGRVMYPGVRAVRDALQDGEAETFATVHLVNEIPDGGAPLVRSWAHPVSAMVADARRWHAEAMLKAYAFAQQEWMMRGAAGVVLDAALRLIAAGLVDLDRLSSGDPAAISPWLVDDRGRITAPQHAHTRERLPMSLEATA